MTGLTRADAATQAAKAYAIALADTVLVTEGGSGAELLTANAARTWTDNAYFFNVRLLRCSVCEKLLFNMKCVVMCGSKLRVQVAPSHLDTSV